MPKIRLPGSILTVVFRNDAPIVHCNSGPTYRSVRVALTDEQREKLALVNTHSSGFSDFYEEISLVMIDDDN